MRLKSGLLTIVRWAAVAVLLAGPLAAHGAAPTRSFWVKHDAAALRAGHAAAKAAAAHRKDSKPSAASGSERDDLAAAAQQSMEDSIKANRSVPWSIVVGLTLLTLLPALLLSMTPLVRLLVVFHFLRQALGTQTAPSNQVLMGLGLMMTWFLMQPVLLQVEQTAVTPYRAGAIAGDEAIARGIEPVKQYMLRYARQKDLELFASAGMGNRPATKNDLPFQVVVPAYILSELKAGFQIGAVLFFPFLLVDLMVASVTTSIGMMQLPPVVISTPLKILLFVMVDGWNLLADQLLKSFS
ncbi:MAG: flagellar type III secretion system pore protein FliP [Edaphobacter sp.]|uniref:flagellar type III secretion system pore protein FliP n=1 Tax=Edaphobacter sp. TaxID=1934404 RepID=UPI00239F4225|nr:flagellar type III secretion system pore protein FliP [Edaphobacter sp.]MDE1178381.1 flagellar type III secretion system pore protein FliP [Edaphobacter sp.]